MNNSIALEEKEYPISFYVYEGKKLKPYLKVAFLQELTLSSMSLQLPTIKHDGIVYDLHLAHTLYNELMQTTKTLYRVVISFQTRKDNSRIAFAKLSHNTKDFSGDNNE